MKTKRNPTQRHLSGTKNKIFNMASIPHHYVGIHYQKYDEQPTGAEMGKITNYFKKQGFAKKRSLLEIFEAASQGQTILPANFEVESEYDKGRLGAMRFVSSSLIMLDVDDDQCVTNPTELLEKLKGKCAGYFHTFSHGIKGARFRLVFSLDRPITDENIYKAVVKQLAEEVRELLELPHGVISPIDTQAKVPTTPIRTGRLQPVISDLYATLDATDYIQKARREELRRAEVAKASFEGSMQYRTTFEELKEMAETIGYLATKSGEGALWKILVMAIKHYAEGGTITDSEGYELYAIISGPEASYKVWNSFKPNGSAKIATLVKFAKERGYKRKGYRYALSDRVETYNSERHKVKKYIPTELAKEFIERNERLLISSPTGSGKSTAFIGASKELHQGELLELDAVLEEMKLNGSSDKQINVRKSKGTSTFYIFSVPTRALAKQLHEKFNVTLVVGSTKGLFSSLFNKIKQGERIFIVSYDMTNVLMDWISNLTSFPSFTLMIDEYHRTISDYTLNYRLDTLRELQKAIQKASSFIALSGTISEILKTDFDKIIEIDNGHLASPCQDFAVYTYEKQKEALPLLVQLIEAWTVKRKLLIYIQSKEVIAQLYDLLRKRGIETRTISASDRRNKTYDSLMESESVPDEVQVILSTSIIAEGISINNRLEWECIAVSNHFSDLFNVSTLKQMSNRFRNEYRRFSIFMQQPIADDTELFNLDAAYRFIYKTAERFVTRLNEEFSFKELDLFRASVVEKNYGIHVGEQGLSVDKFFIRHEASKAQERYYKGRRVAFIEAVQKIILKKFAGFLNLSEAARNKELDLSLIETAISELHEEFILDREARKEGIEDFLTSEVYQAFHDENKQKLSEFKELVLPEHYSCIKELYKYVPYETCKQLVVNVKRKCDTHAFMNRIRAIVDVWYFASFNRRTETKRTYEAFLPLLERGPIELKELKLIIQQVATQQRIDKESAKKVLYRHFIHENSRTKKEWFIELKPLTVERIAIEFNLTNLEVNKTLETYSYSQKKAIRTVIENQLYKAKESQLILKF